MAFLFESLAIDVASSRALWRILLSSRQWKELVIILQQAKLLPCNTLADVVAEMSLTLTAGDAHWLGVIIKASVRNLDDLFEFLKVLHSPQMHAYNLWPKVSTVAKRLDQYLNSASKVNEIFGLCDTALDAAFLTFPHLVPSFASCAISHLLKVSQMQPSDVDLQILTTPEERLPVVDGISTFTTLSAY